MIKEVFDCLKFCKLCKSNRKIFLDSYILRNKDLELNIKELYKKEKCDLLIKGDSIYQISIDLKENQVSVFPNQYVYLFNSSYFYSSCDKCKSYCSTGAIGNLNLNLDHYKIIEGDKSIDVEFEFVYNKIYIIEYGVVISFDLQNNLNMNYKYIKNKFDKLKIFI